MATSVLHLNDHSLLIVPACADRQWVETGGAPTLDVVAVHGLNGGRWSTWSKNGTMWLQDLLPAKLPTARIMTFGYNADLVNNFSTLGIRDHARKLLSTLRNKRDGFDAASPPIVFVCHSLGGIIVKQALRFATNEEPYNELATSTCGVVFLATPHRGSDFASGGDLLAHVAQLAFLNPPRDLVKALKNNSTPLMEITEDFLSIAGKYRFVSFYEENRLRGLNREVVGKHSAVMGIGNNEEPIPLEGNHMEICKFAQDDPRFEEVWMAIRRVAAVATTLTSKIIEPRIVIPKAKFFGRVRELDDLHRFLNHGESIREGVVIWGLSGYGKTQLAIHYVHKYRACYSSVLWIDASSKERVEEAFEKAASELWASDARHQAPVDNIIDWLNQETNMSWLMIFDSVDTFGSLDIRRYLPRCRHGRFIITTVQSDLHFPLKFHGLEIEGVDDLAGSKILLNGLSNVILNESTKTAAVGIARKLRGIPLAIEQASAFLLQGVVKIQDYNHYFQQKYLEHTYNTQPQKYSFSYEKHGTMCAALDMVFEVLQERNPDSVRLLNLSIFLGPGEVPFTTLTDARLPEESSDTLSNRASSSSDVKCLPDTPSWLLRLRNNVGDFGAAIQKLEQVCFMKMNRDCQDGQIKSFIIHELVRNWVQRKLSKEESSEYVVTAFALTGATLYNESGLCSELTIQKYTPRLISILGVVSSVPRETIRLPGGRYASLYSSVASGFGKFYRLQGNLSKAKELLIAALEYRINSEGPRWPTKRAHLLELEELAAVEWRLRNLEDATDRYESLLDNCKRILKEDDEMTLTVSKSLSHVRQRRAEWRHCEERAYSAARNQKNDQRISGEPRHYPDMDDEERFNRPYDEAPVLEFIWRYYSAESPPFGSHVRNKAIRSLRDLCRGYKETGKFTAIRSLLGKEECSILPAAFEGNVDDILELLDQQIIDINEKDRYGSSALHWAVEGAHLATIQLLLEKGAGGNSQNEMGEISLHWAAASGHKEVAQLLLERGSDPAVKDNRRLTALHQAAANGHKEVVQLLLEKGSDPAVKDNRRLTALHQAAANGHKEVVQLLLERGSDPAVKHYGLTVLHQAAANGHKEVVQLLLERGSDPAVKDKRVLTALHQAAANGHKEVVQLLLERGSDPAVKHYGLTVLHQAAANGHRQIVQLLLGRGSDPAVKDNDGLTALHRAAANGHKEVVQLLLERGLDPAVKTIDGCTVLRQAATNGHKEVVQLVLERGSDPAVKDNRGWTALHRAAAHGHEEVVQLLLERGLDPAVKDNYGLTALHLAAANGYKKVVQLLLERGSDAAVKGNDGITALHLAAANGRKKVVQLLLDRGSDPAVEDKNEWTALRLAATNGHKEVVRLLLERGSDAAVKDARGWTALREAAGNGHKEVVRLLLERGSDPAVMDNYGLTVLHQAAANGHKEVVQLLLERGLDPAVKDNCGLTALYWAAANRRKEVVRLLLERGSDAAVGGDDGSTALHWAAASGYEEVVQSLLERGSDAAVKDMNGWTVLHRAAINGHKEVVQLLFERGSDPAVKDDNGRTALHLAAKNGRKEVVKWLLDRGSDAAVKDSDGSTALHWAAASGYKEVVQLLLDRGSDPMVKDNKGWTARRWASSKGHKTVAQQLKLANGRHFTLFRGISRQTSRHRHLRRRWVWRYA